MLPFVTNRFDFRVLRENRRVVQDEARREEIENFHEALFCCGLAAARFSFFPLSEVLTDISLCHCSPAVRKFIIDAYVKGASISSESSPLEGNTAVFTKRRYRDAPWVNPRCALRA